MTIVHYIEFIEFIFYHTGYTQVDSHFHLFDRLFLKDLDIIYGVYSFLFSKIGTPLNIHFLNETKNNYIFIKVKQIWIEIVYAFIIACVSVMYILIL